MRASSIARHALCFAGIIAGVYLLAMLGLFGTVHVATEALHCTVHEGYANPCFVLGIDLGDTLYAIRVLLILGAFAAPLALAAVAANLVVAVVAWGWSRVVR